MGNVKMTITPEELFYLGTVLQAEYIDYDYVAGMGDIQKNYALFESDAKQSLTNKGVLQEDFSGNVEIDLEEKRLLEPIFFGKLETAFDMHANDAEGECFISWRFHFYEGAITFVAFVEDGLMIQEVDLATIKKSIESVITKELKSDKFETEADKLEEEKVECTLVVRTNQIGEKITNALYVGYDGYMLTENESGLAVSVAYDALVEEIYQKIKGDV